MRVVLPCETPFDGTLLERFGCVSSAGTVVRASAVLFVTALTAAAAQVSVPLPWTPVPLTLQPMVVLLGAAVLGARAGAASQALYLALGVAGLPVFAASPILPQGFARLLGPTGGYLLAYPAAAYLVGRLAERGLDRRYLTAVASMAAGLAVVYGGGVCWLALWSGPSASLTGLLGAGVVPFVAADALKLAVAGGAMPALWRLLGRAS